MMMKKDSPSYRIKYLECKVPGHSGQINNLVCLNKNCAQSSLICSFCKQQNHKGHAVQPLKHYLEYLSKQYKSKSSQNKKNYEIQQLQSQKEYLLLKLKESVQELANSFMLLELQIIAKYQSIKTQILQKQFRRNNFQAFYRSMISQHYGDPIFQIQNYLAVQTLQSFKRSNNIQNFTNIAIQQLKKICQNLTEKINVQNSKLLQQPLMIQQLKSDIADKNQNILIPPNIIKSGNILTQTHLGVGKGLGCLNIKLSQFTGKIKIKVASLKLGARLTFGVVDFTTFSSSKFTFDQSNNNYHWFDSQGKTKNVNYSHIPNLIEGSSFDILIKKNHCKISCKGNMCDIQLQKKNESVFFYNLEGDCKIQLTYTNFKQQNKL